MKAKTARLIAPPAQFKEQLLSPGGIGRDQAVQEAAGAVDDLKDRFVAVLNSEVDFLADRAAGHDSKILPAEVAELAKCAAVIFNLAGTYGYPQLQKVVVSLLDTIEIMGERNLDCVAPLTVHARAAKLLAPDAPPLSREDAATLVDQLRQIVQHLARPDPCSTTSCPSCPAQER